MRTIVMLVCLLGALGAKGATFTVLDTADHGPGSLRQAILDANAAPGVDSIDCIAVNGTITLQSALPDLSTDMSIVGPGAASLRLTR